MRVYGSVQHTKNPLIQLWMRMADLNGRKLNRGPLAAEDSPNEQCEFLMGSFARPKVVPSQYNHSYMRTPIGRYRPANRMQNYLYGMTALFAMLVVLIIAGRRGALHLVWKELSSP